MGDSPSLGDKKEDHAEVRLLFNHTKAGAEETLHHSSVKALGSATARARSLTGHLLYRSHQTLLDGEAAKGV